MLRYLQQISLPLGLVFVVGVGLAWFTQPSVVFAQGAATFESGGLGLDSEPEGLFPVDPFGGLEFDPPPPVNNEDQPDDEAVSTDSDAPPDDFSFLQGLVLDFVRTAFGSLAYVTGMLMDGAINIFVMQFGFHYMTSFGGAVESAWEIVRDLINISLIFGLVYIGFRFIFAGDDSGAKRNLIFLLLAALLVNFSLFFAKTFIDITNAAAVQFASVVRVDGGTADTGVSFSGAYIAAVGLNSVLDNEHLVRAIGNDGWSPWGYILMLAISLLIASFVFICVAILLLIRFIVLVFLLVFSPIMFLGFIFPFFQTMSRQWVTKFISQAAIAPAMMLMLYVALLVMVNLQTALTDETLLGIITPGQMHNPNALNMFTLFVLGSGLMIGAIVAASKLGSGFATSSVQLLDSGRKRMQQTGQRLAYGATVGAAAYGARSTGRAAATGVGGALRSTRGAAAQKRLDRFKAGQINMSQREFEKTQKQAQSSYDPRQIGAWWNDKQKALDPVKGGRQQQIKDAQKAREKYDDGMGELRREDYGLSDNDFQARADKLYGKGDSIEKEAFMRYASSYNATARKANKLQQQIDSGGLSEQEINNAIEQLEIQEKKLKSQEASFKFARQLAKLHEEETAQAAAEQRAAKSDRNVARIGAGAGTISGVGAGLFAASALGTGAITVMAPAAAGYAAGKRGARMKREGDRHFEQSITTSARKRFGADGSEMISKRQMKAQAIATVDALKDNHVFPTKNSSSDSNNTKT